MMGLGDIVETGLKPVVEFVDNNFKTDLKNCVKCKKRTQALNQVSDFVTSWFRKQPTKNADIWN